MLVCISNRKSEAVRSFIYDTWKPKTNRLDSWWIWLYGESLWKGKWKKASITSVLRTHMRMNTPTHIYYTNLYYIYSTKMFLKMKLKNKTTLLKKTVIVYMNLSPMGSDIWVLGFKSVTLVVLGGMSQWKKYVTSVKLWNFNVRQHFQLALSAFC